MAGQNVLLFENALKELYLPAWKNQLSEEPTALLGAIKKMGCEGESVTATAPIGLGGGFGFGYEGLGTPEAGEQKFSKFKESVKDAYVNIAISHKVMMMSNSSAKAMANALETEVKSSYVTAKWNTGRALFGNGTGVLTTTSAVVSKTLIPVADATYLKEGLIVDFHEGAVADIAVGTTATTTRRILAVDRSATPKVLLSGSAITAGVGFITVQNSYGREFTGLGSIFDDSITSLYGLVKADNAFLAPTVIDANDDIDDDILTQACRNASKQKNSEIDMFLCGDTAYDAYAKFLRTNNIRYESTDMTLRGGFTAITFKYANRVIKVVNEQFVPTAEMWGVDTTALELHASEWDFVSKDGGIFNLMEGTSIFRALLASYGNLICTNPGGLVRIHSVAYTA